MKNSKNFISRIPALFLLLIYLLNPLKLSLPYLDYQINYNYIVNFLCENKDKPQMHCNGKCYLSKALKNSHKDSNQQKIDTKNFYGDELPGKNIVLKTNYELVETTNCMWFPIHYTANLKKNSPPPKRLS